MVAMVRIRHKAKDLELDVLRFIVSCVFGFFIFSSILKQQVIWRRPVLCNRMQELEKEMKPLRDFEDEKERMLYIGIMSTKENLNTRVLASIDTWMSAQNNVRIEVFSSNSGGRETSTGAKVQILPNGLRVIELPGVKDRTYPPQKKSFAMIKYMHDHYLDRFKWFMRLDDDAYVKLDELESFLSRVNSSEMRFIGQMGFGRDENDYIAENQNYCMGGPGILLSQALLRKLGPKLGLCLQVLWTDHEDVELGRCVTRSSNVKCTSAWDTYQYFYQNYPQNKKSSDSKNIMFIEPYRREAALTLHSNKDPSRQCVLHRDILNDKVKQLLTKTVKLRSDVDKINHVIDKSLHKNPELRNNSWSYLSGLKNYHHYATDLPVSARSLVLDEATNSLKNAVYRKRKQINVVPFIKSNQFDHIYYSVNPLQSYDNFARTFQNVPKNKYYRKQTLYLRKTFANDVVFFEETKSINKNDLSASPLKKEKVIFILTIIGRASTVQRFLNNFETEFLWKNENVGLIMTIYDENNEEDNTFSERNHALEIVQETIDRFQSAYPWFEAQIITIGGNEPFSRGAGLQQGIEACDDPNSLIFLCDVDMLMKTDILDRIRRNTQLHKQVFFPIVFGQYDPDISYTESIPPTDMFLVETQSGFWRTFSYGMVSFYKSDFMQSKGFDLSLKGWGMEDVRLFSALQDAGLSIFRAIEPSLVHVYHDKNCDITLKSSQLFACRNSRAQQLAPKIVLNKLWRKKRLSGKKGL